MWSLAGDKPVQDFTLHSKEIYTIKWSPTGAGEPASSVTNQHHRCVLVHSALGAGNVMLQLLTARSSNSSTAELEMEGPTSCVLQLCVRPSQVRAQPTQISRRCW